MKIKSLIMYGLGLVFLTNSIAKPITIAYETQEIRETVTQQVKRLANTLSDEETEDPEEILYRAIENYKIEFDDYINITGLNVFDKEDINLPNFDPNYIAPTFGEVMYDYQEKLEKSLTEINLEKYERLRMDDFDFDRYVALNSHKYLDLKIRPKYIHPMPIEAVTATLVVILSNAGLTETAITAFTGAVSTLSSAISTSWIPFVGWALAVALAVGALIALAVIIVQYWDEICSVINDIKNWFLEQFSAFNALINEFFSDAIAQGKESTIAKRVNVGGKTLEFEDVIVTADFLSKIVDDCNRNDNIWLLGNIGNPSKEKGKHWWICYEKVDENFVTSNNLYDLGVCTYTWYNNTAKRMMANGSATINGDYSLLIYDKTIDQNDAFGWNHYHLGVRNGKNVERNNIEPYRYAHSFFGLLYIKENGGNENGNYKTYPTNP